MHRSPAAALFVSAVVASSAAFAQAPQQVDCIPDEMVRCGADGKCETRKANERDKREVLRLDFAARKASTRRGDEPMRAFGDIAEVREAGGKRTIVIRRPNASGEEAMMTMTLDAAGKLEGTREGGRIRFTAICTPAK